MLHRNRTILCAVLALLVLSLCACQAQSEHSGASASAPTSQETGDQIVRNTGDGSLCSCPYFDLRFKSQK